MKSIKPVSEIEIETKLDAPFYEEQIIINECKKVLEKEGWEILGERNDKKSLLYYDSSDLKLHREGATLRRVTPFNPKKFPGRVRYDFKQGRGQLRVESKGWSNELLEEDEIVGLLGLENRVKEIKPIVKVRITPRFLDIEKEEGNMGIELKFDTCLYYGKPLFRELELELKKGEPSELYRTSDLLARHFGFKTLTQQKYSRVVEMLQGRGL